MKAVAVALVLTVFAAGVVFGTKNGKRSLLVIRIREIFTSKMGKKLQRFAMS